MSYINRQCKETIKNLPFHFRDAEEELDKLTKLADRINSQINSSDPPPISNGPQTVDLDQLFNFLSQVRGHQVCGKGIPPTLRQHAPTQPNLTKCH